jgi:hypothetical protein
LSLGNVTAQTAVISLDPAFQSNVEKAIGTTVPGSSIVPRFALGFTGSSPVTFTDASYSLASGAYYDIDGVTFSTNSDTLRLNVNFRVPATADFSDDWTDTLTVSASGATPFVLPIRGTTAEFYIDTTEIRFDLIKPMVGDTIRRSRSITTLNQRLGLFNYILTGTDTPFTILKTGETAGIPISTVNLQATFIALTAGETYRDTILVTHPSYAGLSYRVPLKSSVAPIDASPLLLHFDRTPVGDSRTDSVTILTADSIVNIYVDGSPNFTWAAGSPWNPNKGGYLTVTYTPDSVRPSDQAELVLVAQTGDSLRVRLSGSAGPYPTISITPSGEYEFDNTSVGTTRLSARITVILNNPYRSSLTDAGAIYVKNQTAADVFNLESIQAVEGALADTAYVVVSFTPSSKDPFEGALWVHAEDAQQDGHIELRGEGVAAAAPALSPQQTTAIAAGEASAAPVVSVLDGNIVVSKAPAGSAIEVYNLNGQALKSLNVASDTEIVKTASFPKSVYIVLVNDKKQVILRQKILL